MIKENYDSKSKKNNTEHENNELKITISKDMNETKKGRENAFIKITYSRKITVLDCLDTFMEYKPLIELEMLLPKYFIRCNASTIINKKYIKRYHHTELVMENGELLRIGRSFKNRVLSSIEEDNKKKW